MEITLLLADILLIIMFLPFILGCYALLITYKTNRYLSTNYHEKWKYIFGINDTDPIESFRRLWTFWLKDIKEDDAIIKNYKKIFRTVLKMELIIIPLIFFLIIIIGTRAANHLP